jgi:hypothetical protein
MLIFLCLFFEIPLKGAPFSPLNKGFAFLGHALTAQKTTSKQLIQLSEKAHLRGKDLKKTLSKKEGEKIEKQQEELFTCELLIGYITLHLQLKPGVAKSAYRASQILEGSAYPVFPGALQVLIDIHENTTSDFLLSTAFKNMQFALPTEEQIQELCLSLKKIFHCNCKPEMVFFAAKQIFQGYWLFFQAWDVNVFSRSVSKTDHLDFKSILEDEARVAFLKDFFKKTFACSLYKLIYLIPFSLKKIANQPIFYARLRRYFRTQDHLQKLLIAKQMDFSEKDACYFEFLYFCDLLNQLCKLPKTEHFKNIHQALQELKKNRWEKIGFLKRSEHLLKNFLD